MPGDGGAGERAPPGRTRLLRAAPPERGGPRSRRLPGPLRPTGTADAKQTAPPEPEDPTDTLPLDGLPPETHWLTGRYELLSELGRGGMAVVYLARERDSGRQVAIKLIGGRHTRDPEAVQRFAREAQMVADLHHPNIVRTLEVEERDGAIAIVHAYVHGETLRSALNGADGGRFDYERAAGVLRDVAAGLAYAHGRRIVHRDVKPENIFLLDGSGRALLADFGIARSLDADTLLTAAGSAIGTPAYMSPEQVDGRPVDERTDVYSLGLVGWEMLAGRRPWQGETLYNVIYKQKHEELPGLAELRPDIPAYLLAAIEGALPKDPESRWRDASAFLARLSPTPAALPDAPTPAPGEVESATVRVFPAEVPAPEPVAVPVFEPVAAATQPAPATPVPAAAPAAAPLPPRPAAPAARQRGRRWWPAAAGLVALAILALLVPAVRHRDGRAATPGAGRDSLLHAEVAASLDSAPRVTTAGGEVTPPPAPPPARSRAATRTPAAAPTPARATAPATAPAAAPDAADAPCRSARSADQRACLLAQIDRHDAALTRAYQALIAVHRRRAGGAAEPPAVRDLRVEQRAWLVERDRECRARTPDAGTYWGVARAPCFAELSDRRAAELRARLGGLGAGA